MTDTRYTLSSRMRLQRQADFRAVYATQIRQKEGPLAVWARPNGLDHLRLGLAISRRVGNACVRNRIKRMLRETFRHLQHDWPRGYDVVIRVERHRPLTLADYRRHFVGR